MTADPKGRISPPIDLGRYAVRPFAENDYGALARIQTAIDPDRPFTAEEYRHWDQAATRVPGRVSVKLVAEERATGEVVAAGGLEHTTYNFHPRKFWASVSVEPRHQGLGIAREIYRWLGEEANRRGAVALWSSGRSDDPRAMAFLASHGFEVRRKTWDSRLEVASANLERFPDRTEALLREGIEIRTLAEEGPERVDVRERLFQLAKIASRDVPRMGEYSPVTYEEFVHNELEPPGALADALFLARRGNEYVGMTSLERELARPDELRVGFTGTRPEVRGRGIASELKRRAVAYARIHGFRYLMTFNDSLNKPIWAINEKLGFRQRTVWVQAERPLASNG